MRTLAITVALGAALAAQACNRGENVDTAENQTADRTAPESGAATTDEATLAPAAGGTQTQAMGGELSPQTFVTRAANANMLEIEASRVALERTQNAQVREYAQRMVNDHTKVGAQMQELAPTLRVNVPGALDGASQNRVQTLRQAEAAGFDRAYMDLMVESHREAVDLFTRASGEGAGGRAGAGAGGTQGGQAGAQPGAGGTQGAGAAGQQQGAAGQQQQQQQAGALPAELQRFAAQTLPTLREHLEQAQQLQGRIGGANQGTGAAPRT